MRTMAIGGSAAPPAMIAGFLHRHGLVVTHAWGMTELNPVGTLARPRRQHEHLPQEERLAIRATQGYALPLVELRHVSDAGKVLPWDGSTMGELEVRGPWVASSYYGGEGSDRFTPEGWFKTGDVVTLDADGYVRITDRSKDVIKSGGEWISSVDLEKRFVKWWLPDDYVFIPQIPRTSTGKFLKTKLREDYGNYLLEKQRKGS